MQPALKLFIYPSCPYCQRVEIVVAEKLIDVERVIVSLKDMPDWYKQLNPRETVPTLQVDGKRLIFESNLICNYLDELTEDQKTLAAHTPQNRYRVDFFIQQSDLFIRAAREYLFDPLNEEKRCALNEYAVYIDKILCSLQESGPFVCDNEFSLAEASLVPFLIRLKAQLSYYCAYDLFEQAPTLKKLYAASICRPSVRNSTLPFHEYIPAHNRRMPDNVPVKGAQGGYALFGNKLSPYTDAVLITCAAKKIKPFWVDVDLAPPPAWFAHVNPRGTVPVLLTPEGQYIHESRTIAQYVDHVSHDGRSLTFAHDADKAYAVNYFMVATAEFVSAMVAFVADPRAKDVKEKLLWASRQLNELMCNSPFGAGPFHGGDHMHAGDIALLPYLVRLNAVTPTLTDNYNVFDEFPSLNKLLKAGVATEETKGVFADDNSYLQLIKLLTSRESNTIKEK